MKCSTQSQYIREHILVSIYISDIIQSIQPDLIAILQSPILQSSTHTTPGFCCVTLIESTSNVSSQSSQRSYTRQSLRKLHAQLSTMEKDPSTFHGGSSLKKRIPQPSRMQTLLQRKLNASHCNVLHNNVNGKQNKLVWVATLLLSLFTKDVALNQQWIWKQSPQVNDYQQDFTSSQQRLFFQRSLHCVSSEN